MKKIVSILLLLLLLAGCRKADTNAVTTPAAASSSVPAATATEEPAEAPAAYAFTFAAQTLDGETVTESVFGEHTLTMVNVWASWCGPCRGELPELGQLYGKLPEGVGLLSVTVDAPGDLSAAKDLLLKNGCTFPCLDGQGSEGLMKGFLNSVMAIPTTLFFDSQGNQVGEALVGVPRGSSVADAYLSEIQTRLDQLNGK